MLAEVLTPGPDPETRRTPVGRCVTAEFVSERRTARSSASTAAGLANGVPVPAPAQSAPVRVTGGAAGCTRSDGESERSGTPTAIATVRARTSRLKSRNRETAEELRIQSDRRRRAANQAIFTTTVAGSVRVLLVSPRFAPSVGGVETFTADLAAWLSVRGVSVTVHTRTPAARGADDDRPYEVVRGRSARSLWTAARRADVVHVKAISAVAVAASRAAGHAPLVTHGTHQVLCPAGIAWGTSTPCGATPERPGPCASCPVPGRAGAAKVRALRAASAAAAANIVPTEFLVGRLGLPRTKVIANPVRSDAFAVATRRTPESDLIAHVGRLGEAKGLDLLLTALARVPGARLEVAGDGPMRRSLEDLSARLDIAERVTFLGEQDRSGVLALLARAAVACVPSRCDETFGYTAAEAMAGEVPLVVTPRGALPELVGVDRGWVADDMTSQSLTTALHAALEDDAEARRRATLARAHALAHYHEDTVGEQYLAEYVRTR